MIRSGRVIDVGFPVVHKIETFPSTSEATRPRTEPMRAVVLHHTAGERGWEGVTQTLKSRTSKKCPDGLSVHFIIDRVGTIYQTADLDLVTFHAGRANGFSVGVEIVNRGAGNCLPRHPRETYRYRVRGRYYRFLKFYSEQVEAAQKLTKALCEEFGLPYSVPRDFDGSLSTKVLGVQPLSYYRGVLGHLHITDSKIDPSPHLLEAIK